MKISEIFQDRARVFSAEVFPPKRDGNLEALFQTIEDLKALGLSYISVTYGAGGSTREMTLDIATRLIATGITPLVHLTCTGHSQDELRSLLSRLKDAGIENVLALRGDPPKGESKFVPSAPDGFRHASELVNFIRKEGFPFCVGVAGYPVKHPEAASPVSDMDHLKAKIDAGAQFVVTQLFFDNSDYFRLVEGLHRRGVNVPVQPGIWLLTDFKQVDKIASLGVGLPGDLRAKLEKMKEDPEAIRESGVEFAAHQCADLMRNGAPGVHFYVMNKSASALRVHANLHAMGLGH